MEDFRAEVDEEAAHQFQVIHRKSTACRRLQRGGQCLEGLFAVTGTVLAFLLEMYDIEAEEKIACGEVGVDGATGGGDEVPLRIAAKGDELVEVHAFTPIFSR